MNERNLTITQADGHVSRVHIFQTEQPVKGSVLVLHGMAEHHERYLGFAAALNDAGLDVWLYDHRGHGKHTAIENLGFLAEQNGHRKLIDDAHTILETLRHENRSSQIFLFGHSMGSLVGRCLLQEDDQLTGAILCGTTRPAPIITKAGVLLCRLICALKGVHHRSPFLNGVLFGNALYKKVNTRTDFDWLTRDDVIVDQYIADPYCGFLCTAGFYRDLVQTTNIAGDPSHMLHVRKDLPMAFIAGAEDPVGGCGKEVQELADWHRAQGYQDIECTLYPTDRHEILNEFDREQVTQDIISWLLTHTHSLS